MWYKGHGTYTKPVFYRKEVSVDIALIQERILERIGKQPPRRERIGCERVQRVLEALAELKKDRKIHDFLQTEKLGFRDLILGIDCYVILVGKSRYIVAPINSTGSRWVRKHMKAHSDVWVVAVDSEDTKERIKQKLVDVFSSALAESN